ncbi:hypothetical protein IV38_GL001256 [Lactobacillus selangorensis]|uniref:HTH merR-type domain-containing protein n=1 Tax=Lactobacillus selangorensis TaxID=81857 RepID=A0A0R2FKF7_9LACO|nr:MerR family transcriptional regulator [Lactobacillus selangorensis]KRN29040.1 hypothetical protein IV38_GL001256 [Lactobacillus selangorensis]KRN30046.1 hypothetical protein IV40_GL002075 [Lactobacillus selangorensis]
MSDVEFKEVQTPSQAAKKLGVSVATLRKYSLMIEKTTSQPQYFERNSQNMRLYTHKDIENLEQVIKLSHQKNTTLQDAIRQLYAISESRTPQQAPQQKTETAPVPAEQFQQAVQQMSAMNAAMNQQEQTINDLQTTLATVQKQNAAILRKLDQQNEHRDQQEAVKADPNTYLHSEKEDEAAQRKTAYAGGVRTLADMQVSPLETKQTWWQKLLGFIKS